MELRLDRLLHKLRDRPAEILERIDHDPLLMRRESGGLVLANASQALYTPTEEHQLYAKGIVYRRDPYRLVSLPLIKIYNVGERDVTVEDLAQLAEEENVRLRFLRKMDGSLVQVFRAEQRVWFTTRGMIEGGRTAATEAVQATEFDYLGVVRELAQEHYPALLHNEELLQGRTLLFELIHPAARVVTDYGDRTDLVLLAVLDHHQLCYLPYPQVVELAEAYGLSVVEAFSPGGETLDAQVKMLLDTWAGTDEEGSVIQFERPEEVIYRVKVKSPDYLRLMKMMADCTYANTVAILENNPHLTDWERFQVHLQDRGTESVPEELLVFYRQHQQRYHAYLSDCEQLLQWAEMTCRKLLEQVNASESSPHEFRKAFAAVAQKLPLSGLLFARLDDRLDLPRLRQRIRTPEEARTALAEVGLVSGRELS